MIEKVIAACRDAKTIEAFASRLLAAFLKAKDEKASLIAALKHPMAEIDGHAIMKESAKDVTAA